MAQTEFALAVLDPEAPLPRGLVRPDGADAPVRFAVYRNNVVTSLIEALAAGFPAVQALVGEEFFRAMAGVFVRAHPPTSPLMFLYGAALPAFIAGFPPARALPYLADVARLDFARREAFHAADAPPLDPGYLGSLAPDALEATRLAIHPATRTLRSDHPVLSIWQKAQGAEIPLPKGGQEVLIARPAMTVTAHLLPPGGADFVEALRDTPLGAAAASAGDWFDLPACLATCLAAGAFTRSEKPA
ncbi:MAG: DNA-binding domain-containing protein [Rubricella sp.]